MTAEQTVPLVVVGSVGIDTIRTPVGQRTELLGGSASYACAAASFFTRVGLVGVVGSDFPSRWLRLYRRFGIDLTGLQQIPGRTFRWSGEYRADMNVRRTLTTELNVFADFRPELPPAYRRAPFFLLGNISPTLQLHVLEQATNPRFVAADTMDLWIRTAQPTLRQLLKRIDLLLVNDSEAERLTGTRSLRLAAERLLAMGPRWVVIKRGEYGSALFGPLTPRLIPGYLTRSVRDPTGAGDAFAGALMGALARAGRLTPRRFVRGLLYGTVVASFVVEDFSLRAIERLGPRAIRQRLLELRRMLP